MRMLRSCAVFLGCGDGASQPRVPLGQGTDGGTGGPVHLQLGEKSGRLYARKLKWGHALNNSAAPVVTVGIPTYNRASLLRGAIESVLAQTFTSFELRILDDASDDSTPVVARAVADSRVDYLRHPSNIGMTANWNKGFELARGMYVALLHDDDRWDPTFLERAVGAFTECPDAGFVYAASATEAGLLKEDRILASGEALDRLRRRNEVPVEAVVVRREALLEIGGFRGDWPYSMDWQAWLEVAARHPVGYIADPLGNSGEDAEDRFTSRISATPLAIARDRCGMLRETIPRLPVGESERRDLLQRAMRSLTQAQLVAAWSWAAKGDRARARVEARFAFQIDRSVALRSPQLVAAMYAGLLLPKWLVQLLNRHRSLLRPVFRRD